MGSIRSSNGGPTEEDFFTARSSEEFLSADSGWTSEGNKNLSASTEAAACSLGGSWRQPNKDGSGVKRGSPRHSWDVQCGRGNAAWNDYYVHLNLGKPERNYTNFGGGWGPKKHTNRNRDYSRGRQLTSVGGGLAEDELLSQNRGRRGSTERTQRSRGLAEEEIPAVNSIVLPEHFMIARGTVGKRSSREQISDSLYSTSGPTGNARATSSGISSERHNWTNPGRFWNDDYAHFNRSRPGSSHTKFGGGWAQEEHTNRNGGYRRSRQVTDVRGGLAEGELSPRNGGRRGREDTQRSREILPTPEPSVLHCAPEELMIVPGTVLGKHSSPEQSDHSLCSTSGQTGNAQATVTGISSEQQTSTSL